MSAKQEGPHFRRAVICGVGLLGGSLGLALRERRLADSIVGVGRRVERLKLALDAGAIGSYSLDAREACADADLVVLCGPVSIILEQLPEVIESVPRGALVTDVGSTKRSIVERAAECARDGVAFVGSHPIAGSERSGVEFARADLYQDATVILTPDLDTSAQAVARTRALWQALGMRVIEIAPTRHDFLLAAVSHQPHLAAAALVALLERALDESPGLLKAVAGPGFRDTTRIAMGSVPMWLDICFENRPALLKTLDAFISILLEMRKAIAEEDRAAVEHFLETAARLRKGI